MIKKLLILLFLFLGLQSQAQFPTSQTLGSPTTTTLVKGVLGVQYGMVIQSIYADTVSINNSSTLDNIGGILVKTTDGTLWLRSPNATYWASLNASPGLDAIYTSGYNQNSILVNAIRSLSTNQYNGPVTVTSTIENETDSAWYRYRIINKVPNRASGWFISQSDSLNRMVSTGLNPTPDSTKGFQVLFNQTGANLGYRSGAHFSSAVDSVKGIKVDATTKVRITGNSFLFPRLTTAERTALPTPEEGLSVYDLDLHKLYIWDGTTWQAAW